jgi:hydrogenase/urease accessory protein HupE
VLALSPAAHAHRVDVPPPASSYFRLGVEHILLGFDHLLFVLGIAAAQLRLRPLFGALTAFTLAHSITLCLGVTGVVTVSPDFVEPLIALSLAYVGIENLVRREVSGRWRVTFAFGLIHGFGFAGALSEVGLPEGERFAALALFNAGVEVGQIAALAAVLPVLILIERRIRWTRPVLRALSGAVAVAGVFWCVVRVLPESSAAAGAAPIATPAPSGTTPPRDERASEHSVYASASGPTPAGVEPLCRALHETPRQRRAECGGTTPGIALTAECTRTLGAAVRAGAVRIDGAALDTCISEWTRRYEGCDWVGAPSLPPVAACQSVLRGTLSAGSSCRSSLECGPDLFCHGVGPMDLGRCGPPGQNGAACGTANDPLIAHVHAVAATAATRECKGECVSYRCRER